MLAKVEENIKKIGQITTWLTAHPNGEGIAETILEGLSYKELYRQPLYWRCTCSLERIENVLLSLRQEDKEALLSDPQVEMTCHYCGTRYVISHDELVDLYEHHKKSSTSKE